MDFSKKDIELISKLENYNYVKTMKGVVPLKEKRAFDNIKQRLRTLSKSVKSKYDDDAGIFKSGTSSGNPISFHGNLRRVWSGVFKGAENKQYSAQISFVINPQEKSLDVGFYFGRAASANLTKAKRRILEDELKELGVILYNSIISNEELRKVYNSLFEYGFDAEIKGQKVLSQDWLDNLLIDPTYSSLVFHLKTDQNNRIEYSDIDFYASMALPLISILPEEVSKKEQIKRIIKSLTPEQRARQAEKRALIGLDGENYIMQIEKKRLSKLSNKIRGGYPIHQAIISDSFGYDILSKNDNGNDIFIEVKTTTYLKEEVGSKTFYISSNEIDFYDSNKAGYRLYRVYDIYGSPSYEILELDKLEKDAKTYRIKIP